MRLPNLDLALLAAHYLLSAVGGERDARGGAAAPHAGPCPERIHPALANATRAGILDIRGTASARVGACATPSSAP